MRLNSILRIAVISFFWLTVNLIIVAPAQAAHCRTVKGQPVCITSIKRSAKFYWQYRATLSIAGKNQPPANYDCRSRAIIDEYNTALSFKRTDPAAVVCDLFRERSKSMRLSDLSAPKQ
jgi:hypothetical protein